MKASVITGEGLLEVKSGHICALCLCEPWLLRERKGPSEAVMISSAEKITDLLQHPPNSTPRSYVLLILIYSILLFEMHYKMHHSFISFLHLMFMHHNVPPCIE